MAESEFEKDECELYAFLDDDGQLVIEVDSVECQNSVMDAVSKTGVSVRYIKPEQELPISEFG